MAILALLALSAVSLTACRLYDWWYYKEFRDIQAAFAEMPGVAVVAAGGNEDLTYEDIYAVIRLRSGGSMTLGQLSAGSFSGAAPFFISEVGELRPHVTTYGFNGVVCTATHTPIRTVGYTDAVAANVPRLSPNVCCEEIRSVADAVQHYPELHAALARWPQCPAFRQTIAPDGTVFRACVTDRGSERPPEDPLWPQQTCR